MKPGYVPVIGLEVHLQLKTKSKMFSGAPNLLWQAEPNSTVSPVELGLPGALPVPNQEAIRMTQQFGACLKCELNSVSKFDRKNYFYPDLPKGYQISQYDQPFCINGQVEIETTDKKKTIRIRRIHLEEDTGKSMHKNGATYLDFNKSGTPLVELVTEPDLANAEEASALAKMVQEAARALNISDADMEKGNLRLEANISVRKPGQSELPDYRVEVKNINSFKFLRDAINYEINRQIDLLEKGETLPQQTRGWNEMKSITVVQREKENAHDYRYFPEPDIPPLVFSDDELHALKKDLPLMPWDTEQQLIDDGVRADFAKIIAYDRDKQSWFAEALKVSSDKQKVASLVSNSKTFEEIAKRLSNDNSAADKPTIDASALEEIAVRVIAANQQAVADYRAGKENAIKFLLGQVMRETKGAAQPADIQTILENKLTSNF